MPFDGHHNLWLPAQHDVICRISSGLFDWRLTYISEHNWNIRHTEVNKDTYWEQPSCNKIVEFAPAGQGTVWLRGLSGDLTETAGIITGEQVHYFAKTSKFPHSCA
eukprot:jgi/Ulvmu1/4181/UM019_0160.1